MPGTDRDFRDPAIAALPRLLDPAAARPLFAALHPHGAPPEEVSITFVRYKPGRSVVVAGDAVWNGERTRVYAKAGAKEDASRDAAKAASRPARVAGGLLPSAFDGVSGAVLFAFPQDAALRGLPALADPSRFKRVLERAFPGRSAAGWRAKARGTIVETLRYKPEDRFVFRAVVRWRNDRSGAREETLLYGRVLPRANASRAAAIYRSLPPSLDPGTPPLLGFDARTGIVLLGPLEGEPLLSAPDRGEACRLAGKALARFQTLPAPSLPAASAREKRERLRRDFEALARISRRPAAAALSLLDSLRIRAAAKDRLVHGDFHADQVLLSGERVSFLDLDRAGRGKGDADPASFRAALRLRALRGELEPEEAGRLVDAFDSGSGMRGDRAGVEEALALLDLASSAMRRLERGWPTLLEKAVAAAQRRVPARRTVRRNGDPLAEFLDPVRAPALIARALGLSRPASAILDRAGIRGDGTLEFEYALDGGRAWAILDAESGAEWFGDAAHAGPAATAEALEPARATALLEAALGPRGPVEETRVLSVRPGRRATLRWRVAPPGGSFVAKLLPPGKAVAVAERWSEAAAFATGPRLPRLLATLPAKGLLLLEDLEGESLHARLSRDGVSKAGEALRAFHATVPPGGSPRGAAEEVGRLRESIRTLERFEAPWRVEREAALEALLALETPPPSSPVAIHGDFYDRQVLLRRDGAAFLDLDAFGSGDAALDAGNFAAHLHLREAQGRARAGGAARLEAAFLRAVNPDGEEFGGRFAFFRAAAAARLLCLYSIRGGAERVVPALLRLLREATGARR